MKILSLCCGGGGIEEGVSKALGGKIKFISVDYDPKRPEYSKDCLETIKLNHPNSETLHSNMLDIEDSIGKADVVVGGPPCQDFSLANTNRKLDPTLVNCFFRIVEKTGAKYWLMENVPDVIKVIPNKRNFLINCADYGTPQTRKRRFFTNLKKPDNTHSRNAYVDLFGNVIKKWISVGDALGLLYDSGLYITKSGFKQQNGQNLSSSIDKPAPTIVNATSFSLTDYRVYSRKYLEGQNYSYNTRKFFNELDQPARTVLTKNVGPYPNQMIVDKTHARKLTLDECAVLQGFPATYKFFGGKTSVRRQIGNAVPSQPIKAFFEQLR